MKKRLFGLALVLALCLTLLSVSALAAEETYNLWVNGVQVTDANATDVLGDADEGATVSYDAATNTLTLNGAVLDKAYDTGVIYAKGTGMLTINVVGDSQITAAGDNVNGIYLGTVSTTENPYPQYSLLLTGSAKLDIYVTGNGSAVSATTDITVEKLTLEADVTNANGGNVFFVGGKTIIKDAANLNLYSANYTAIYGEDGVEISGGTVIVEAPKYNPIYSSYGDVTITGTANVTATGYYGIVGSNVAISDNAKVDTTSTADCGIYTAGTVTISENADVTANGYYAALRGDTKVEITGGTVEATSVDDCGIYSDDGDIDISGGNVRAVSDANHGIFTMGNINISGGTVYAETRAPKEEDGSYNGIFSLGDLVISGGEITAVANGGDGIYAYDTASVSGDAVVNASSADGNGLNALSGLTISGSADVSASSTNGSGIFVSDQLKIEGSAQLDASSVNDDAIYSLWALSIDGSVSVSAVSESAAGIYTGQTVSISDGAKVSVEGETGGITALNATNKDDVVSISGSVVDIKTPDGVQNIQNTGSTGTVSVSDSWVNMSNDDGITATDSVIFTGTTGQVYGDATVPGDVEVPEGKTLNIPANKTLVVPEGATLTNNGIITVAQQGAVTNDGTIVGDIQNAGTTTNNGIIQGAVTGEGTTNNGGIIQDGDSIQVSTKDAVQKMINTSVGKTEAVVITLTGDITGDLSIPIGAYVVIDGGNQYKIAGKITCTTSTNAADVTNLTLKNLTMDGDADGDGTNDIDWAISSANQSTETVNALNLTLKNCTVKNYANKGMYLTNAKTLRVNSCTFENNATVEMNSPNSRGDYTIDLNLVAIQGADISITNTTFKGECGKKAVVKVVQRGANDGTGATDITGAMASIANFNLSGCTFADTTAEADVNLGTAKKDINATAENLTGNFPATISGNATVVVVRTPYLNTVDTDSDNTSKNTPTLTVPAGRTATKAANGVLTVKPIGSVTVTPTPTPEPEELPFTDVSENLWFYDYVAYVYSNGLMDGTSDTTFEPNANMTRAMVWAILARIDGETVTGANWADTAREWAMAEGVSDGENANGYVTREQLATMLWRYAGEPDSDYSLSAFTDAASVSDYAETAMAWAVEHGIITGMTDTAIEPQGTATRAQCAAMLMRFVEL